MQIEGLKVTDYIKTEGADSQGYGVGTSGIKDDKTEIVEDGISRDDEGVLRGKKIFEIRVRW